MLEDTILSVLPSVLEVWQSLSEWSDRHLFSILAIIFGAWIARKFGSFFINHFLTYAIRKDIYTNKKDREKRINTLSALGGAILRAAIFIIALLMIAVEINPDYMTAIFAGAGIFGVALGFGAKDLIADFTNGVFIIIENQFRVGDVVDLGEVSGIVEDITIRTTVLRDLAGNVHHVPNGTIKLTSNMTLGHSGISENIEIGYGTDIDLIKKIINDTGKKVAAMKAYEKSVIEPIHYLRLDGFGANGILIKVVGKTTTGNQWDIKGAFYEKLYDALNKHKIEIPYPHVTVDGSLKNNS